MFYLAKQWTQNGNNRLDKRFFVLKCAVKTA